MVYNPKGTLKRRVAYRAKDNLPEFLATPLARYRLNRIGVSAQRDQAMRDFGLSGQIVGGPFRGMKYLKESTGSSLTPRLLGTYEMELHAVLEQAMARTPKLAIDVGSAEGFYAVGFAWRCPQTRVIAFDTFGYARFLARKLAKLNGVSDRVTVRAKCDPASLGHALNVEPDALVFSDCEGYELTLLDPGAVPALAQTRIIVETHDFLVENSTAILIRRFEPTHDVTRIDAIPRTPADFPAHVPGPDARKLKAMHEGRPPGMSWLHMTPRLPDG